MMLHIGCGNSRIEEFVNIDCRRTLGADVVADAWDLDRIDDNSVEYIYARHTFEHLSRVQASQTLKEWWRVLEFGGLVHLVVPNLEFHAKQLLGMVESPRDDQRAHAMAGFYGWQNDDSSDLHRWGYTPLSLATLLYRHGFEEVQDGIEQLTTRDVEPWHINMRAMKTELSHKEV